MEDPIELTYQISRQECVSAAMSRFWRGNRKWVPILGVAVLLMLAAVSYANSGQLESVVIFGSGAIFLIVFTLTFTRLQASWTFKRTPGIASPLTVRVLADRILLESAVGRSEIKRLWRVTEDSQFLFGHLSAVAYILVPKRAFSSQGQLEDAKGVFVKLTNAG